MSRWGKKKDEPKDGAKEEKLSDLGRTGEFNLPKDDDETVKKLDEQLKAELEAKEKRGAEGEKLEQSTGPFQHPPSSGDSRMYIRAHAPEPIAPILPDVSGTKAEATPLAKPINPADIANGERRRSCRVCGNLVPDGAVVCTVDGTSLEV